MSYKTSRFAALHRALPLQTLAAAWLAEGVQNRGQLQMRPGQMGPSAVDEFGIQYVRLVQGTTYPTPAPSPADYWVERLTAAVAAQATCTRAAQAGVRHVCTGIYASYALAAALGGGSVVQLRDGASGAGAILWEETIANAGSGVGVFLLNPPNIQIKGTAGNAMTLEFGAAGPAATQQRINMTGYSVPA